MFIEAKNEKNYKIKLIHNSRIYVNKKINK